MTRILEIEIQSLSMPKPRREFRFDPHRLWRFDLAWPRSKVAVEIQGGIWIALGRHSRGEQQEKDMEKFAHAQAFGWVVVEVSHNMIQDGRAMKLVLLFEGRINGSQN